MDNGTRRHQTYSFFVSKEQVNMILQALDALEREYQARTVTDVVRDLYKDLRRRVVNCQDAIRRREKQPTKGL